MEMNRHAALQGMLNVLNPDGGDFHTGQVLWWMYLEAYSASVAHGVRIGAIVRANVDAARNDGKIRRFPWNARSWHLDMAIGICNEHNIPYYGEHESQIYARKSRNSAEKARDYHITSPRFRRGDILEEMRSELNINPVDYFNFTGYPTVVR